MNCFIPKYPTPIALFYNKPTASKDCSACALPSSTMRSVRFSKPKTKRISLADDDPKTFAEFSSCIQGVSHSKPTPARVVGVVPLVEEKDEQDVEYVEKENEGERHAS